MFQSDYSSNSQTTNFARASRVILGPCRDVLCAILDKKINPSVLLNTVSQLIAEGKKLPFTVNRIKGKQYSDFDISLLCSLFRNIDYLVTPHAQGWGRDPEKVDRSISANIERIRIIRNKYAHSSEYSITDTDFKDLWKEIFQIVQELEKDLGTTVYQDGVKEIEICTMDPEESKKYIEIFVQLNEKVDAVAEELEQMKKSVVPLNIQEQYEKDVSDWKEHDKTYFETHNFPAMFQKVRDQPYITLVGAPGSGKSATAHHIALKLQDEKYDILPISDIKDIELYGDVNHKQVFVIDDVLGKFGLSMNRLELLDTYMHRITSPAMPETKIIMTSRKVIFKNTILLESYLRKDINFVDLQSDENSLTNEDKRCILTNYGLNPLLIPLERLYETSNMFPLLCKMISKEKLQVSAETFFIRPIQYIKAELDTMRSRNKIQYASLVILMINQNKLSKSDFESNTISMRDDVLNSCKVDSRTPNFEITEALEDMEGTFTHISGCQFSFIHDSMFEIVAWHFGREVPELILKCMSSDYIANYIKVRKENVKKNESEDDEERKRKNIEKNKRCHANDGETDLSITLQESKYSFFAERLFRELTDGYFITVFKALEEKTVKYAFYEVIKKKQYTELYDAFLLEHDMRGKHEYLYLFKLFFSERPHKFSLLYDRFLSDDYICNDNKHSWYLNALSLVVFNGHSDILELIIKKMKMNNGNLIDLFQHSYTTDERVCEHCNGRCRDLDMDIDTVNEYKMTPSDKKRDSKGESDIGTNNKAMTKREWQLLCLGCFGGDFNTVSILLEFVDKIAINTHQDRAKPFPLTIACKFGFSNIAKELVKAGADVNPYIKDISLEQPILSATYEENWDLVKELIKVGADINQKDRYSTPLKVACKTNNLSAVKLLIKAGASINLKAFKKSPLQIAKKKNNFRIVEELIKAGVDVDLEEQISVDFDVTSYQKMASKKYKTPLIEACQNAHFRTGELLIAAGADVNKGDGHRTPIEVACQNRDLKMVKMLIKAGATVNPINADISPLMLACRFNDLKCVQEWIKAGAFLNFKKENKTPLIMACDTHNIKIIKELIKEGADVNLEAGGRTPLTVAVEIYCYTMIGMGIYGLDKVNALIKGGADVNSKAGNITPLIIACQIGHSYVIEVLIKAGADVNLEAGEKTPLIAVLETYDNVKHFRSIFCENIKNKIDAVKVLVQTGADFNQKAGDKTPLTLACQKGLTDVVDEFIKAGADFNLATRDKAPLTDVCQRINRNVKRGFGEIETDTNSGLRYKSQLLIACLRKQLNIADFLKTDGGCFNFKDDGNAFITSEFLKEHTIKDEDLVKLCANINTVNVIYFFMKYACQLGHLDLVKELLKVGIDPNLLDGPETPLIIACQKGHVGVIRELIKAGVDVNLQKEGNYPLTVACKALQIDAVKELLQAGASVNLKVSNETPLTAVCKLCQRFVLFDPAADQELLISILEELIKAGSDVNMKADDKTPLTIVCRKRNIDAVKLFLKSGADVNLEAGGITPITAACKQYNVDVVKELIRAGANVNQKDAHNTPLTAAISTKFRRCIDCLIEAGADVNLENKDHTPLTLASQKGNLRTIKALIDAGADVNRKAWNKRPLTVACKEQHFHVVKFLIKAGACVNLGDGVKTPLEIAYEEKCMRIADYLVNAGASIESKNDVLASITIGCQMGRINDLKTMIKTGTELNPRNVDKTPLTAACQKGDLRLVKELINAGASVDLMDRLSTPLTTACLWGHVSVVKELICSGASVNMIDKYNTPLTTACLLGHLDIVKELIKAGSKVNLRDVCSTPLTTACFWGESDIVKELLKSGADVNLQDEENTPLTVACLKNRIDIVKELIKAKANVNLNAVCNTPLTAACAEEDISFVEELIDAGSDVNLGVEIETTTPDAGQTRYACAFIEPNDESDDACISI